VTTCPNCGQENPDGARFCNNCSTPLEPAAAPVREERKVVTVLFADLVGFTARAEELDPEDVRALLAPYHAHLRAELEHYGGTVEKFIGDAVVALFGAPASHEDDPVRAVRAAIKIRDWAAEQGELQVRIAVTTGEALVALGARPAEGEAMAAGDVVNTASRLQSAASANGILVDETTYRATRHVITYGEAEPVEAKGKSEPILVWEAREARSRFGSDLLRADSPLFGRERELHLLHDSLDRARSLRQLQLVTLVGVPGIGKSRLVHELFRDVDAEPEFTTWRQGRSLPYGEGISFWALAEIVKAQAGIMESDPKQQAEAKLEEAVRAVAVDEGEAGWLTARLRSLLGVSGTDDVPQSESFSAWKSFLEGLAEEQPLVLVFEDLHWADDGLLDFIDQLADWARSEPILVLCTARPELLERRPGWGGGKANASTLSLPPLEDEETARLFASLLESPVLPAETQAELLARAAGNPLYAEQYARMLSERGTLEALPETVQGIIAARLDVLSEGEKRLLQDAAVVGKVFWLGSVCAIGGFDRRAAGEALLGLERKELVQRARRSTVEGEAEYGFRHLLVRDVAYGQIPRRDRAARHRAAARWVEGLGRADDHAEMLASHYLSALEYSRAASIQDDALAAEARPVLRDAGERAAALYAWPAAARFYTQALALWPEDDPERPYVLFRCGVARVSADGSGLELVDQAIDELEAAGNAEVAARAAVYSARTHWWLHGDAKAQDEILQRALTLVGDRPDSPSRVAALAQQAAALNARGLSAEAIEVVDDALPAAERQGLDEIRARLLELRGAAHLSLGNERGFTDLNAAVGLATAARAYSQLHTALNNRATQEVSLGRLGDARRSLAEMQANVENDSNIGTRRWVHALSVELYFMTGDWADATRLADAFVAESDEGATHVLEPSVRMLRAAMLSARGEGEEASAEVAAGLAQAQENRDEATQSLARAAFSLLADGRNEKASELLSKVLELGEALIRVLNDSAILDGAWVAHDLGRSDEYQACIDQSGRTGTWAEAAAAICAGDFGAAAEVCRQMGYRPGEAYARLRAARELVEEGRRAEADAELQSALTFWREVEAARYVREGEALLAASA
jgi:class 3 adenylate cyclase/tetratricopeptide (TPR) repeat protein